MSGDEHTGVAGELASHRSRVQRELAKLQEGHTDLKAQGGTLLNHLSSLEADQLTSDDLCNLDDKVAGFLRRVTKAMS